MPKTLAPELPFEFVCFRAIFLTYFALMFFESCLRTLRIYFSLLDTLPICVSLVARYVRLVLACLALFTL